MKKIFLLVFFIATIAVTLWLTPQVYRVHHHANMMVWIDGKKWDFSREKYMEEVSRCNITTGVRPEDRIHLHDGRGDIVHVHMAASTWGDLFANIGWTLTDRAIFTDEGTELRSGSGKNIVYILDGEELLLPPSNMTVETEARLLVYYGTGTYADIITSIYPEVASDARVYNQKQDPASCSQNTNAGVLETLKNMGSSLWKSVKEVLPHGHNEGEHTR